MDDDDDVDPASTAEPEKEAGANEKNRRSDSDSEFEVATQDEGVTGNDGQLPSIAVPGLRAKEKAPADEENLWELSPEAAPPGE